MVMEEEGTSDKTFCFIYISPLPLHTLSLTASHLNMFYQQYLNFHSVFIALYIFFYAWLYINGVIATTLIMTFNTVYTVRTFYTTYSGIKHPQEKLAVVG